MVPPAVLLVLMKSMMLLLGKGWLTWIDKLGSSPVIDDAIVWYVLGLIGSFSLLPSFSDLCLILHLKFSLESSLNIIKSVINHLWDSLSTSMDFVRDLAWNPVIKVLVSMLLEISKWESAFLPFSRLLMS
jgi:hypothetical protein